MKRLILFNNEINLQHDFSDDFQEKFMNIITIGKLLGYEIRPWCSAQINKGGHYVIPFYKNRKTLFQFALLVTKDAYIYQFELLFHDNDGRDNKMLGKEELITIGINMLK